MKKNVNLIKLFLLVSTLVGCNKSLPTPEVMDGLMGAQFGVDKNINVETIDKYLNRKDTVYRDTRMLIDPANYEAIGGDSYLSGFINGFEVVPYPFLAPTIGLPNEVGNGYTGDTLFSLENNEYIPNYNESISIINSLFPKDKYIFLMCGGGGYASMTKNLLISLGYDQNKIYNVGGYWYYEGKNKVEVKQINENNEVTYNFDLVTYHNIDFNTLTKI